MSAPHLAHDQVPGSTRTLLEEADGAGTATSSVRRTVLPGGLRVVTEHMPGVRSAAVGVWVGVGSRDETPAQSGASHFLEHLLFKGTEERTAMDISASLDEVGGELNAFTATEYTCYHARVLGRDLPLAVDVLGDMVTSSRLAGADVEAEREVILDEIAMHDDDPDDVVHHLFAAQAWGPGPLGRPVAGTADSVQALTPARVAGFYRSHYTAPRMVVAVAGDVDHDAAVEMVRASFARRDFLGDHDARPVPVRRGERTRRVRPGTATAARPFEQVNLVVGVDGVTRTDPRRYALGVLDVALGGGPSSRLFQEVRERRGLAYSVYSYSAHFADAGALAVAVGCLPARTADVLGVVGAELDALAAKGLGAEEVERGKGQLRGGLVLGLEDSVSRMARIAKADLVYAELPSIEELIGRVDAVTVEEVADLARDLLDRRRTLAVVGPADSLVGLPA